MVEHCRCTTLGMDQQTNTMQSSFIFRRYQKSLRRIKNVEIIWFCAVLHNVCYVSSSELGFSLGRTNSTQRSWHMQGVFVDSIPQALEVVTK